MTSRIGDKTRLSGKRRKRFVETDDYAAFIRRAIRAYGRRIADGDVEALPGLLALSNEVDNALGVAVAGLRQHGYSWTEIAARIGVTRQAARQRWAGDSHD
jgi:hypothetical protein